MQKDRFSGLALALVLGLSILATIFINTRIDPTSLSDIEILDSFIPRLGGNGTPYIKFRNGTGTYQTSQGQTIPLPNAETNQQYAGSGASIRFDVGETNGTHTRIADPTSQTEGYLVANDADIVELNGSRGMEYRHYYNVTTGEYRYESDLMVNKSNVMDDTDWLTVDEYPHRYVIRLTNGSIKTFDTPQKIGAYLSLIDNSTIWAVGYESFWGVMGFYMNFADLDWGHGQYLYWPRLKNGQLTDYNQPQYAIYSHLYANYSGTWYDKILNDRSLYDTPSKNPRNTLHFYNTSDTFGLYFTTYNVSLFSSTWDFSYGFKYNFTDGLYHMINEFQCRDRDFLDIGWGYEITSSPQSDGTPYQPSKFVLYNEEEIVFTNVSSLWNYKDVLPTAHKYLDIVSQNNETFKFTFEDMVKAGFTEARLETHDQQFPDGSTRRVLLAGMYGYGNYTNGTWIEIDPSTGTITMIDDDDLFLQASTWKPSALYNYAGYYPSTSDLCIGFMNFDTGVDAPITSSGTSSVVLTAWVQAETMDSGESVTGRVYNVKGNADSNTALESSQSYSDTAYTTSGTCWTDGDGTGWQEWDNDETLTDYWANNRDIGDEHISFRFYTSGAEVGDYWRIYDRADGIIFDPYLSFTYSIDFDPPDTVITEDGSTVYAGKNHGTVVTYHYAPEAQSPAYWQYVYLQIGVSSWDITLRSDAVSGGAPTVTVGSGYVISAYSCSVTDSGTEEGYDFREFTWGFCLDWDYAQDGNDIDYNSYATDDWGQTGTADSETSTGETFENEIVLNSLTLQGTYFPNGIANGQGNTLEDGEYFLGGMEVGATGDIGYRSATSTVPDRNGLTATIYGNGSSVDADSDTRSTTTSTTDGSFTIAQQWTTHSASGLETDYPINVTYSGDGFVHATNFYDAGIVDEEIDAIRDNENPTYSSFSVRQDGDSGADGYAPNTGYEDDSTLESDFSGASDGSGSGIWGYHVKSNEYGVWGSSDGDGANVQCTLSLGTNNIYYNITDNVGNYITGDTTEDIFYGTSAPTSMDVDINGTGEWSSSVTYAAYISDPTDISSGTLYYNPTASTWTINFTMDGSGDWGSGGAWKVWFANRFGSGEKTDSTAPYYSNNMEISGASATEMYIDVINNCGVRQRITITCSSDSTGPVINTYDMSLTADTDSDGGNDIDPQAGYYDDQSVDVDFTGAGSDAGSGINSVPYAYKYDGGAYQSWTATGDTITSVPDGANTIYVRMIDKVGNIATEVDSISVHVEVDSPTGSNSINEISGTDYIFVSSGTLLYYTDTSSQFEITTTFTDDGGSGEYGVFFGAAFDLSGTTDTDGTYVRTYNIDPLDTDISVQVIVFNNGGNSGLVTITTTKDTSDPTTSFVSLVEDSPHTYIYASGQTVWFSDLMGATDQLFTVTVSGADGSSGVRDYYWSAWDDDVASYTTDSRQYSTDSTEVTGSITVYTRDNVGNVDATPITITMTEDTTTDTPTITGLSESSSYLHTSGVTTFWYGDDMGSEQTLTVTVSASDAGGSGVYSVTFPAKFGESSFEDTSATYESTFGLDNADTDTGTITMTAKDNVGNTDTVSFTTYRDTTAGSTAFSSWSESSFFIYTSGSTLYFSDEGFTDEESTLTVTPTDGGANPSGVYSVEFGVWDEQTTWDDTGSPWERIYTFDGDDTSGSITAKMTDNVGNVESTLTITITRLTEAPTISIAEVPESSDYLYNQSLIQFWYGDDMSSAQSFSIDCSVNYAGLDGILHVNATAVWFGDNPLDSGSPYSLDYTVESSDTDTGTLTVIVWTNTGKNGTDTLTISRDTTSPNAYSLSSPAYDGDGNVTVTGSTTDADSGMRTTNTYEWWVNATRDFGSGNWTTAGTYEFQGLPAANQTFYAAAYDFVGNWVNATASWTVVDFTAPEIYWNYLFVDNTSNFYLETTNNSDQTIVYIYYNPSVYTFAVFLNFTAFDQVGGSIANVTYSARFGDTPANDTGATYYNATYTIELNHSPEDSGESTNGTKILATAVDNVGLTASVTVWFYRDLDAPTLDLTIDDDPDALLDLGSYYGWYNDTSVDITASGTMDGDHPPNSGLPTNRYAYKYNSSGGDNSYSSWEATTGKSQTVDGAGTWWLWVKVRDYLNNTREYNVTAYVDLTAPVFGTFDWISPIYSDNFYRAIDNTAGWNITWTETNPYLVNGSNTALGYTESDSSPSGDNSTFTITITGKTDGYYNISVHIFDNAGNRAFYRTNLDALFIDNTAPTITFAITPDAQALDSNYYSSLLVYTLVSGYSDGVSGSGAPSSPYAYKKEGYDWSVWTSLTAQSWTGTDQTNVTLYVKARDNLGWVSAEYSTWVIVDTVSPILGWLTLDEQYAPNWYDQNDVSTANVHINWIETYPHNLTMGVSPFLSHTNDTTPSGTGSDVTVTISGAADGSYVLSVTIYDKAGNSDTTLLGTEGPIRLSSGMASTQQEFWHYFYFFRSDGFGLDWRDFNVSYVIDETYRNYTEVRIRGALYAQKYLNQTSSVRFVVRNYFGDVVANSTYSLPASRDLYITLNVNTLKIANLHDEVMNMTIERTGSATTYSEQIMPYEVFSWHMYAAVYNITIYVDEDGFGYDRDGNAYNDLQVNLTINDVAKFVDIPLRFIDHDIIISEIMQINIATNKDYKSTPPRIYVYLNDSLQTDGYVNPGVIVLSRPTYGVYNYTVYSTWQSFNYTYQDWITVQSNAIITNFVVAGLEETNDYLEVSWNTNKGTGSMTIRDNSSVVAIFGTEGVSHYRKSTTVGLHQLNFSIVVEALTYNFYANFTIADWTAVVTLSLQDNDDNRVPMYSTEEVILLSVTRSDGVAFTGIVEINGTDIVVTNSAGSVALSAPTSDGTGYRTLTYSVTDVRDGAGNSRDYVANDLDTIWDSLQIQVKLVSPSVYVGEASKWVVNASYAYDDRRPTQLSYNIYIDDEYISTGTEASFEVTKDTTGTFKLELRDVSEQTYMIDYSSGTKVKTFTVSARAGAQTDPDEELGRTTAQIIIVLVILAGLYVGGSYLKGQYQEVRIGRQTKTQAAHEVRQFNTGGLQANFAKRSPAGVKGRPSMKRKVRRK